MKYVHSMCYQKQLVISNHMSVPCEEKGYHELPFQPLKRKRRHLSVERSTAIKDHYGWEKENKSLPEPCRNPSRERKEKGQMPLSQKIRPSNLNSNCRIS